MEPDIPGGSPQNFLTQKNILIAGTVIIVILLGVFLWMSGSDTEVEQAEESATQAPDTIEQVSSNPVEQAPDLNPAKNTNPFTDVYKNPFD